MNPLLLTAMIAVLSQRAQLDAPPAIEATQREDLQGKGILRDDAAPARRYHIKQTQEPD